MLRIRDPKRFLTSQKGIKVYLKPEYHPTLKETDLLDPDFLRKASELFDKKYGNLKGLPKICSENSEDAQTWGVFSPLLSISSGERRDWLEAFLEKSLGRRPNKDLIRTLAKAELMFWRGRRERPIYSPPPNLHCAEGNTEVDLTILTKRAIIFVEAKYQSEISTRTTHCPGRDQIIRNIDVGTYYAWNKRLTFYFILLSSTDCTKSIKRLRSYQITPQNIVNRLPDRADITNKPEQIAENLGLITWNQLKEI